MIFPYRLKVLLRSSGFTLIELVVTILLLAILSVAVLPRFFGAASYNPYALRQTFISELRQAQMLALHNPDRCYRITVDSSGYQLQHLQADCSTLLLTDSRQAFPRSSHIELLATSSSSFQIQFDSDGRSVFLPGNVTCQGHCLAAVADDTVIIDIESEGYIHEG